MFLKKDKRPNGRLYLSIVEGYRDPITKKNKQRKVKYVGFLDELEKEYEDPIAYFSNLAKEMTDEAKNKELPIEFSFSPKVSIDSSTILRKNIGFSILSYFYHELDIDKFFINRNRNLNISFSLNNIMQLLVFTRVLYPSSKKKAFENMDKFFLDFDFKLDDIYRALDYFYGFKEDLLLHIHEMVRMKFNRDTTKVFYDVTNYYFEIKEADNFRKKGISKEHRPNPIIQMGLLMDNSGLPITYRLFEGNTNDSTTLMPVLHDLKNDYGLGKVIVVADKGINTGENIAYNILNKNGYIYSQTVRGGTKDVKDFVLADKGYSISSDGFKIKSRIVTTKIWVENDKGKRVQVDIDQKQVAFYSPDYDKRAKHEREKAILKAEKIIEKTKNGNLKSYGASKYVESILVDKESGEIFDDLSKSHYIDSEKIEEEEKYDGYYLLVTSELKTSNEEILNAYRNLWKIEETFKITKSELETRPVYVSLKDHIESHFLTCFISLLLLRLLENRLDHKYSTRKLIDTMKEMTGTYIDKNYYMFDYYDNLVEEMGRAIDVDFSRRFMTLGDIKKITAGVKK